MNDRPVVVTATNRLLAFAADGATLTAHVRQAALTLLDDTLAVGAAGSSAPGAAAVRSAAAQWGAGADVPLLGTGQRLTAAGAAFVNGFQVHCLEWDAVHEKAVVHAMSVVTAALHAVCNRVPGGVDPDAALGALVAGVEIACALGVAAIEAPVFFRPATAGLLGASLACARIAAIPPERFADVLGLAYGQCAGTMQAHVEGSIALPLQIAHAARAAVTAVDLVAAGLTGPHDVLEGSYGYTRLFDPGSLDAVAATLGRTWRVTEISIKPWPCGRASHGVLGSLEGIDGDAVLAIDATVPPLVARLVGRPWRTDMTPAYARLCLPFLAALMLADGRIDPRRFTAEAFGDPGLQSVGQRLTLDVDSNPDPNALAPQQVRLSMRDGTRVRSIPDALGSPGWPLPPARHAAKLDFARSLALLPPKPADPLAQLAGLA